MLPDRAYRQRLANAAAGTISYRNKKHVGRESSPRGFAVDDYKEPPIIERALRVSVIDDEIILTGELPGAVSLSLSAARATARRLSQAADRLEQKLATSRDNARISAILTDEAPGARVMLYRLYSFDRYGERLPPDVIDAADDYEALAAMRKRDLPRCELWESTRLIFETPPK